MSLEGCNGVIVAGRWGDRAPAPAGWLELTTLRVARESLRLDVEDDTWGKKPYLNTSGFLVLYVEFLYLLNCS